jgi:hypothetical protein
MGRILLIMVIGGAVLGWIGLKEWRLSGAASAKAQDLGCDKLESSGPGENAHIVLKDYLLCTDAFVYKGTKSPSERWTTIWVPAVPAEGAYVKSVRKFLENGGDPKNVPHPTTFNVIVKTSNVHNQQDLSNFDSKTEIEGLVVNKVESLGGEEKRLLNQAYPGINVDKCYILEEGRMPKSRGAAGGMMAGGLALIVLGVAGFAGVAKRG